MVSELIPTKRMAGYNFPPPHTVTHYVQVCGGGFCDTHENYTETICIPSNGIITFSNAGRPTFAFNSRLPMPQNQEEIILFNRAKDLLNPFGATTKDFLFYAFHPELLMQAKRNFEDSKIMVTHWFCNDNDHTNANAFKHALWSGLNTLAWGINLATEAAAAHEALNIPVTDLNPLPVDKRMDMTNNYLGFALAAEYLNEKGLSFFSDMHTESKRNLIKTQFGNKVVRAIASGQGITILDFYQKTFSPSNALNACKPLPQ